MDFSGKQLGALRMTGFEPDNQGTQMAWSAISGLSAEEKQTLMVMLLFEVYRTNAEAAGK